MRRVARRARTRIPGNPRRRRPRYPGRPLRCSHAEACSTRNAGIGRRRGKAAGRSWLSYGIGPPNPRLERGAWPILKCRRPRPSIPSSADDRALRSLSRRARGSGPGRVRLPCMRDEKQRSRWRRRLLRPRRPHRSRRASAGHAASSRADRRRGGNKVGDLSVLQVPVRDGRGRAGHVPELPRRAFRDGRGASARSGLMRSGIGKPTSAKRTPRTGSTRAS